MPSALHDLVVTRPANAATTLRSHLASYGYDSALRANLAHCLARLGKLDDAVASYRQSLALDPTSPETHLNLSIILDRAGRIAEALASPRKGRAGPTAI